MESRLHEAPGIKGRGITAISRRGVLSFIKTEVAKNPQRKEPFYVMDVNEVLRLMDEWTRRMPMVRPFYAVKCNPEPALISILAMRGAGFDCASKTEIEALLELGVPATSIVYANTVKAAAHLEFAASVGANLTTFDSLEEIKKVRTWHPECSLLIRIKSPMESTKYPLGSKFGALPEEIELLLQAAKAAGMKVVGVSFHVGSMVDDMEANSKAIGAAKGVFDAAIQLGLPPMHILDIGGGFTAGRSFQDAASAINRALEEHFANEPRLSIIAEPGRFFADTPFTLATNITGKRIRRDLRQYWINDGIYGSMNCVLNKHTTVEAIPLACVSNPASPTCNGEKVFPSTVFGPTCDSLDTVFTDYPLPELQVNEWLVSPCMGAYTVCGGSKFNGFDMTTVHTVLVNSVEDSGGDEAV